MAFDKTGFVQWLISRKLKAAPKNYPSSLDAIETLGKLSINQYVPAKTPDLLALLQYPGTGHFKDKGKTALDDWRSSVNSYDAYMKQRIIK